MKKPTRGSVALGLKPKARLAGGGTAARISHLPGAKLPKVGAAKPKPGPYSRGK